MGILSSNAERFVVFVFILVYRVWQGRVIYFDAVQTLTCRLLLWWDNYLTWKSLRFIALPENGMVLMR